MGRRYRNKRRRKSRNFTTCDDGKEIVLLNSWLSEQGMRRNEKLVLAVFDDTGRGVMTKKKIKPGEELMNLPLNSTINVSTILMDKAFCSIFLENNTRCLLDYKKSVSFQSLMAFYLVFIKMQGSNTKWFVYLESLPKEYTVPYFLPNEAKNYLDDDILAVISKQTEIVVTSFHIFDEILKDSTSDRNTVNKLRENYTLSIYEWAYFTVNTRCVYMDLSKVIDLNNIEHSILNLIRDNTKISLCPYLDMINHSPNARNETKLMVSKNIENVCITDLNEDLFSDIWFSIYTKNNFESFTQVFICYGDSHNLKLITEYGFYIPANDLDSVSFNFDNIISFLESKSLRLSLDQISFINSHGLNKDLYIDHRGLSFNLYGLLMVVNYYYNKEMDVSRLIYSAAICSNDTILNNLITPMVEVKLVELKESVKNLEKCEESFTLNNCVDLMNHYIEILEKFIKC